MQELERVHTGKGGDQLDHEQRRSIWMMNHKMKNEVTKRAEKLNIINQEILPNIKEICSGDLLDVKKY